MDETVDPLEPVDEDDVWHLEDETDDWVAHAKSLGIEVQDYDDYVSQVEDHNGRVDELIAQRRKEESSGMLREMFPDGVDEDNVFNRDE